MKQIKENKVRQLVASRVDREGCSRLMRFNYEVAVDFNRPGAEQLNDINERLL